MIAITNTGVTSIVVAKEQVEKTRGEGVKETDFRVCVGVNKTNEIEAVLVADGSDR